METMYDISFSKLSDNTIRLEQPSGVEEPNLIDLHPEQLRFIARRVAGLSESSAEQVEDLERKIGVLTTGLASFVCDGTIRSELLKYCPTSFELLERLDGLLNLAWEFDGRRLTTRDMERATSKPISAPSMSKENAATSDSQCSRSDSESQLSLIDQA